MIDGLPRGQVGCNLVGEGEETVRVVLWVILALVGSSCSLLVKEPPIPPQPPSTSTKLPNATLNGVAGQAWSWCWATGCGDGAFNNPNGPLVEDTPKDLSVDLQPTQLQIYVHQVDAAGKFTQAQVPLVDGNIGAIPAGEWKWLTVTARWDLGNNVSRDVSYSWRLR